MKQNPKPLKNKHPKTPHKPATGNMQAGFVYYTKRFLWCAKGISQFVLNRKEQEKCQKMQRFIFLQYVPLAISVKQQRNGNGTCSAVYSCQYSSFAILPVFWSNKFRMFKPCSCQGPAQECCGAACLGLNSRKTLSHTRSHWRMPLVWVEDMNKFVLWSWLFSLFFIKFILWGGQWNEKKKTLYYANWEWESKIYFLGK